MPAEPPGCDWQFPPVEAAEESGLVCIGADLAPGTILAAYRAAMFPMPVEPGGPIAWWSPDPRAILELDDLIVHRSLRRSQRRFDVRIDTAFESVISACAEPDRADGWIDDQMREAYTDLHRRGWAHSVESWRDDELVGGLYGVVIGGLFAGESMFHRERDASKVALMGLVEVLSDDHPRLLDVQWRTPHLASLGVREIPRTEYMARLAQVLGQPRPSAFS